MNPALQSLQAATGTLAATLNGRDAAAIIASAERLAVAAVLVRDSRNSGDDRADVLAQINDVLAQLSLAAAKVNLLNHWTRQRIDTMRDLRQLPASYGQIRHGNY